MNAAHTVALVGGQTATPVSTFSVWNLAPGESVMRITSGRDGFRNSGGTQSRETRHFSASVCRFLANARSKMPRSGHGIRMLIADLIDAGCQNVAQHGAIEAPLYRGLAKSRPLVAAGRGSQRRRRARRFGFARWIEQIQKAADDPVARGNSKSKRRNDCEKQQGGKEESCHTKSISVPTGISSSRRLPLGSPKRC